MLPGRSPKAVRSARMRFGRYNRSLAALGALCVSCDERPVWEESPKARSMRLCKGCYLDEVERRDAEEPRANAARQRRFKRSRRGA